MTFEGSLSWPQFTNGSWRTGSCSCIQRFPNWAWGGEWQLIQHLPPSSSLRMALSWQSTSTPHYLGSFQEPRPMERLRSLHLPPPQWTLQGAARWGWVSVQTLGWWLLVPRPWHFHCCTRSLHPPHHSPQLESSEGGWMGLVLPQGDPMSGDDGCLSGLTVAFQKHPRPQRIRVCTHLLSTCNYSTPIFSSPLFLLSRLLPDLPIFPLSLPARHHTPPSLAFPTPPLPSWSLSCLCLPLCSLPLTSKVILWDLPRKSISLEKWSQWSVGKDASLPVAFWCLGSDGGLCTTGCISPIAAADQGDLEGSILVPTELSPPLTPHPWLFPSQPMYRLLPLAAETPDKPLNECVLATLRLWTFLQLWIIVVWSEWALACAQEQWAAWHIWPHSCPSPSMCGCPCQEVAPGAFGPLSHSDPADQAQSPFTPTLPCGIIFLSVWVFPSCSMTLVYFFASL